MTQVETETEKVPVFFRPEAFATPDKSADTEVQLLLEEIISRHSCPIQIVTGTENRNWVMRETLQVFYHPQSNAEIERFHRPLYDVVSKKLHDDLASWDLHFSQTLSATRVSVSDTTHNSPFFLLHGRHPIFLFDNILKLRREKSYTRQLYINNFQTGVSQN